jgi:hypothetical protein
LFANFKSRSVRLTLGGDEEMKQKEENQRKWGIFNAYMWVHLRNAYFIMVWILI